MAYMKQAEESLVKLPSITLEGMELLGTHFPVEEKGLTLDRQDYMVCPSGPVYMPSPLL